MKSVVFAAVLLLAGWAGSWALPVVDGKVSPGEYAQSISLVYGDATLSYSADDSGGLYVAVRANATGWVGVGLGSTVMDGAHIFMGFLKDGKQFFSEQLGRGHSHQPSPALWADASAVGQEAGVTTLELHVPADKVRGLGNRIGFIVAFSGASDVTTYHEDNHDGGFIDLRPSTLQQGDLP
jgi:hypothetical protein